MASSDYDSDFQAAAERTIKNLLPEKSKEKYQKTYDDFQKWRIKKNIKKIDEKALLVYFTTDNLLNLSASTLWSIFSMLKLTLSVNVSVKIDDYNNLRAVLKRKGDRYLAKKSKILRIAEAYSFLKNAPDEIYLSAKVALIVGVYGACRPIELTNLTIDDIEFVDGYIRVFLTVTKTKKERDFVITEGCDEGMNLVEIVKRYVALRPRNTECRRFFLYCRDLKCTRQPIGINTIGGFPKKIATYLKLLNPSEYTGHCFRRSSASFLAESGVNMNDIKRHCGWKSDTVAECYIERSVNNKRKIAAEILGSKKSNRKGPATAVIPNVLPVSESPTIATVDDTSSSVDTIENSSEKSLVPAQEEEEEGTQLQIFSTKKRHRQCG